MSETQQTEQQAEAEFVAGFNSLRTSDDYTPPEVKKDEVEPAPEPEAKPDVQPEDKGEEPLFAGFTEAQLKNLLEKATRVESLEKELRKTHGKIGELNGTLQEIRGKRETPTHDAPAIQKTDEDLTDWEREYPELAAIAEKRAERIVEERIKAIPQVQQISQEDISAAVQRETQLALMSQQHSDWQDVVTSQDFNLWISTQPEDVQQAYSTTDRAQVLGGVISGFKDWKKSTQDRSAKNKQRLEQALTPGGGSKVTTAHSAEDEFVAGFYSARGR